MFSKAKSGKSSDAKAQNGSPPETKAPAANSQHTSKRSNSIRSAGVPSIISTDVVMRGNISAAGEVQFDGSLEGDIKASTLIIGEKASVKGEVICETVTVRGRVEGGIRAKSVSLASTAQILGDILHSSLSVETGAHFEGNCRHSDDPLSESSAKDFRRGSPASGGAPAPKSTTEAKSADARPAVSNTPSFLNQSRSPLR